MKKFALLAVLLVPTLGQAQQPAPSNKKEADNKMICRSVVETGSRLSKKRICMLASEWAEERRVQRQEIEKIQASPATPGT